MGGWEGSWRDFYRTNRTHWPYRPFTLREVVRVAGEPHFPGMGVEDGTSGGDLALSPKPVQQQRRTADLGHWPLPSISTATAFLDGGRIRFIRSNRVPSGYYPPAQMGQVCSYFLASTPVGPLSFLGSGWAGSFPPQPAFVLQLLGVGALGWVF